MIFAKHLQPVRGPVAATGLMPKDDVRPVAEELGGFEGSLMLVGHLPFLSRLASLLLVGDPERLMIRYRNSGIARCPAGAACSEQGIRVGLTETVTIFNRFREANRPARRDSPWAVRCGKLPVPRWPLLARRIALRPVRPLSTE